MHCLHFVFFLFDWNVVATCTSCSGTVQRPALTFNVLSLICLLLQTWALSIFFWKISINTLVAVVVEASRLDLSPAGTSLSKMLVSCSPSRYDCKLQQLTVCLWCGNIMYDSIYVCVCVCPLLTLMYLLCRWKWNGKQWHPYFTSTQFRKWSYSSAQEDPRCWLWRHFQRRVRQTEGPTAKLWDGGQEGESKLTSRKLIYSCYTRNTAAEASWYWHKISMMIHFAHSEIFHVLTDF